MAAPSNRLADLALASALVTVLMAMPSPAVQAQTQVPAQTAAPASAPAAPAASTAPPATAPVPRADAVARVVLSLLSYARWPVERDTVRLCVDTGTRYGGKLMEGGTLSSGRFVETRRVDLMNDAVTPVCDALYLGMVTDARRNRLASDLSGKPVLVIAEEDFECETGSMFCLNIRDNAVSFRVNLDSIARSGIHVHPGVLQLGRRKAPAS
ncbi:MULTISPECIES: YfiR family protein [unclassified Cupriavidus]|uniref:YfiR family protein n=1 Tax=Cupriavidus sp. H19C3 TaxID=3241603 RepID=UPI003BF7EF4F